MYRERGYSNINLAIILCLYCTQRFYCIKHIVCVRLSLIPFIVEGKKFRLLSADKSSTVPINASSYNGYRNDFVLVISQYE